MSKLTTTPNVFRVRRFSVLFTSHMNDLTDALAEIERLREAIRRLAEQDATLSLLCKRDGSQVVTVTMDATLTDAERGAMESALDFCERTDRPLPTSVQIATLRGLLSRLGGGR